MREIANSEHEFSTSNASRSALTRRVHFLLAFSRRLKSLAVKRFVSQFSSSDRRNERQKDEKSASISVDPDAVIRRTPVCEFCGGIIEAADQRCPALDEGRCRP